MGSRLLRGLLGGLAMLVLGAFGLGYASAYLPPESFWWTGPFAVALPVSSVAAGLVALVLLGTGLWRRRYGRVGLAGLVLVAIGMRFALPLRGGAAETASSHDRLTLLTFNVPEARVSPSIAGFVRSTDADLVALQEVTLRSGRRGAPLRLPSALQAILDTTTHRVPTLPPGLRVQQPVLTRIAVDSLRVLPIPGGPTASATRVAFTWQGRRAVLYNVHLHSVSRVKPWRASLSRMRDLAFWRTAVADYREGARMRAAQARTLRRLVDRESVPVIVAGDLNSTPHDWVYHHLAAGMQDVYALRGATGGATYPADEPLVRIDHVLVSEAWDAVAARVLDEHPWSDHRPVVVQLRWK